MAAAFGAEVELPVVGGVTIGTIDRGGLRFDRVAQRFLGRVGGVYQAAQGLSKSLALYLVAMILCTA